MSDDLVTNIVADAQGFNRGADEVAHKADWLEGHVDHMAGEIEDRFAHMAGSVAGAFGVGLGTERFVESIKGQIEKITELQHLSERSGVDLNDLRALQYEAKHAGVEVEGLTKSFTKFQANLGDAAGGGKKREVFQDLGLDPDSLARMNPADAFAKVGDAIGAIENPTSRVHMAMELFGKSGAESLNVITQGSQGLKDAMEHVGIVKPEDVEEMKRAHEAMLNLDASGQKLSRTFATLFAPAIGKVADGLSYLAKAANEEIGAAEAAIDYAKNGSEGKGFQNWIWGGQDVIQSMEDVGPWRQRQKKKQEAAAIEAAKRQQDEHDKLIDDGDKQWSKDDQSAQSIIEKFNPQEKANREQGEVLDLYFKGHLNDEEMLDAMADVADRLQKEIDAKDPLKKLKEEAKHMLEDADPEQKLNDQFLKIKGMLDKGVIDEDQAEELVNKASDDFGRSQGLGELLDNKDHTKRLQRVEGPGAVDASSNAYEAFFKNLQPNVDTEAQRQTELQQKLVDLNQMIQAQLQQINQKTTPPTVVSM